MRGGTAAGPPGGTAANPRANENPGRRALGSGSGGLEATIGFEPMNKGFADPRVRPLRHVAGSGGDPPGVSSGWLPLEDSNLG